LASKKTPKSLIKDAIIIGIGILIIWVGIQVIFGTSNPFYVVSSGSMIPELLVYDVIVVKGNIEFEEIEKGDIIVFYAPAKYDRGIERVIVHRVNTILDEDPRIIQTKGDANPRSIAGTDYPITEKEYLGKVEYVVPQIGYITQILQPPINYIIIAIIIGAMIAKQVMNSRKSVTFADKIELSDTTPEKTNDIETNEQTEDKELNENVDSVDETNEQTEDKELNENVDSVDEKKSINEEKE